MTIYLVIYWQEDNVLENKRHVGISYHTARECEAANITKRYHVVSGDNLSDGLTKPLTPSSHLLLYKEGGPIFCSKGGTKANTKK